MSDQVATCPICNVESSKNAIMSHLSFCRKKNCSNGPMYECCFNTMHVVPFREKAYHQLNCPDKPIGAPLPLADDIPKLMENATLAGPGTTIEIVEKSACIATFNAIPQMQTNETCHPAPDT